MEFFRHFPKIQQTFNSSNFPVSMTDIGSRIIIQKQIQNNKYAILKYTLREDERPEEVSYNVYNSYVYTWTILMINEVYNIYTDWYMSRYVFEEYIKKNFGSIESSFTTIHHWVDSNGYEVAGSSPNKLKSISWFEYLNTINESKKEIKIFHPNYINQIHMEFIEKINEEKFE